MVAWDQTRGAKAIESEATAAGNQRVCHGDWTNWAIAHAKPTAEAPVMADSIFTR
jgi:hypothetical protein